MTAQFKAEFDVGKFLVFTDQLQKQMPYAAARILTTIAGQARDRLRADVGDDLTIRTPWIAKGLRITPAKKADWASGMSSEVGSVDRFMALQATGGDRASKQTGGTQAVPVAARATKESVTTRNKWPGAMLRRKNFFMAKMQSGKLGVWKRTGRDRLPIVLQYVLEPTPVHVPKRWEFEETVQAAVNATGEDIARQVVRQLVDELVAKSGNSPAAARALAGLGRFTG